MRRGARDDANMMVLEAIIVALLLLGAAYAITTMRNSARPATEKQRVDLERTVSDALVVLAGLNDSRGNVLDVAVDEAMHCASDATPSTTDCQGKRSSSLTVKLDYYLPKGAGYALGLSNGVKTREIYRSNIPAGETVSASYAYLPDWNTTFVLPELSCYEAGQDVNATLVVLRHGAIQNASAVNVTTGAGTPTAGVRVNATSSWNVTLPAATRPNAATIAAAVTARGGAYAGSSSYATCNLGGHGAGIVTALRLGTFTVGPRNASVGGTVTFSAMVPSLTSGGISVESAQVDVYEPVPARAEPDTWLRAATVNLPGNLLTGTSASWTVPEDELFGTHPAVLRVKLLVPLGSGLSPTSVEARKLVLPAVALPNGIVPLDSPYRVSLQAWFPDWSGGR